MPKFKLIILNDDSTVITYNKCSTFLAKWWLNKDKRSEIRILFNTMKQNLLIYKLRNLKAFN